MTNFLAGLAIGLVTGSLVATFIFNHMLRKHLGGFR